MIPINKPVIGEEEVQAAARVLRSGVLTDKSGRGPYVTRFERAFAKYVGSKYAVALNSGTAAIHAALLAAGIGPEDEVIVPSFTFVAVAETVALTGARPVLVDISPETFCVDPEEVEKAVTKRTKAIIPVHLYGATADMDPIVEKAHRRDIVVIEDAAQAHGAEYKGRRAGALGHIACFSFYASKNITTGEGGMVTTDDQKFVKNIRSIRTHGEEKPYRSVMIGHNYRMPELEAAIGLVQLSRLPGFLEVRRRNARILLEELGGVDSLELPVEREGCKHSWYVFSIRLKGASVGRRNEVVERLRKRRVGAAVYYPTPIHLMPYYRKRYGHIHLPETERAAKQVFSLPVHPSLSKTEMGYVAEAVKKSVG